MTEETPITFTPRAVERAKALLARQSEPDLGVRVGVRGGGCSGLSYFVDAERQEKRGDLVLDCDGLRVYLDVKSQLFLAGTQIDYEDTLMESGFKFRNPNAKRACSCGDSFTV
jgi:iron-sulfur cluster assembly protein